MNKRIANKVLYEFLRLNPEHDPKQRIMPDRPRGSYSWPTLKRAVARMNRCHALYKKCNPWGYDIRKKHRVLPNGWLASWVPKIGWVISPRRGRSAA